MKHKPYLLGCAVVLMLAIGCNSKETSFTDAEKDSMEKLDKETEADNFEELERLEAEQRAKDSGQASPDAQPVQLNPTPPTQEPQRQENHPGPIQPPPEVKR
jgi:hypothetical protein